MFAQRLSVTVTTGASSGAGTGTSAPIQFGKLSQIRYVKTDFANGSTFAITLEATGETLWGESNVDASATRAPRQATHSTAGVASLYAAGGTAVQDEIAIVNDRILIAVSSAGNSKTGTFHFVIE
jgi:hypothetical protein